MSPLQSYERLLFERYRGDGIDPDADVDPRAVQAEFDAEAAAALERGK